MRQRLVWCSVSCKAKLSACRSPFHGRHCGHAGAQHCDQAFVVLVPACVRLTGALPSIARCTLHAQRDIDTARLQEFGSAEAAEIALDGALRDRAWLPGAQAPLHMAFAEPLRRGGPDWLCPQCAVSNFGWCAARMDAVSV